MSAKRGESRGGKFPKKRKLGKKWKSLGVSEGEIFNFEEEGLISFEELTDYSIVEGGIVVDKEVKEEPQIKKAKSSLEDNSSISRSNNNATKKKKKAKKKKSKDAIEVVSGKATPGDSKNSVTSEESKTQAHEMNFEGDEDECATDSVKQTDKKIMPTIQCDMSEWNGLGLPSEIIAALAEKNFVEPTPIQSETLPVAIFHRQDVIGAAETGSGKTLAFALPILTHILDFKNAKEAKRSASDDESNTKPLYAVILTPTRELAMQIYKHVLDMAKYTTIKSAVIVGGLSEQKQTRVLSKCPEIVIGTPGRLLNLIKDENPHLKKLDSVKFLVIDEVDKMLQFGHYKDATEILRLMSLSETKRQTFLFSATLTLPQYHKRHTGKPGKINSKESVQLLVDMANISKKAKIIDLSTQHVAAEQIEQKRIICTEEEKDLYLLYVLLCHPGRTLIFVNSINCTKKICNLLTVLGRNPLQLHAGKQQRQRLKAFDKFTSTENAILVATDVAARGLDIPDVDIVIHYHLPKDPKIYIHRSGRTARARKVGLSVILEGPADFKEYKKICNMMKLDKDLPSVDIDYNLLPDIKKRVSLAIRIEREEHQQRKVNSNKNWFQKAAKSLDVDLDYQDGENQEEKGSKKISSSLKALRKELSQLLKLPLVPRGFSGTYITRTGSLQNMVYKS